MSTMLLVVSSCVVRATSAFVSILSFSFGVWSGAIGVAAFAALISADVNVDDESSEEEVELFCVESCDEDDDGDVCVVLSDDDPLDAVVDAYKEAEVESCDVFVDATVDAFF